MGGMNDKNWHGGILLYTALLIAWASLEKQKETAALIYSKPPYQLCGFAWEMICPSAVFFFSPLWGQMFLNWFTTSINYKCYTNVRGVFDYLSALSFQLKQKNYGYFCCASFPLCGAGAFCCRFFGKVPEVRRCRSPPPFDSPVNHPWIEMEVHNEEN